MRRIAGVVRHYDWGDPVALPGLLGIEPDGRPWAELWFGAHPSAPSPVVGEDRTLDELVAADPAALGTADHGGTLPFLLKLLAAARPLSIQAHPSARQARDGFAREEAAGVPRDAPGRIYRDDRDKPELVCALTAFEAKCGFRPVEEALDVLAELDRRELRPLAEILASPTSSADAHLQALRWALSLDGPAADAAVGGAVDAAASVGGGSPFAAELDWLGRVAAEHPGDGAVLAGLLLNHVVLRPGEAMFLPSRTLHSYLGGTAVELMANSDNVVRGGLTTKHVDVEELLHVVDGTPRAPVLQRPDGRVGVHQYEVPTGDLVLVRHRCPPGRVEPTALDVPAIVLVVAGGFDATRRPAGTEHGDVAGDQLHLGPGEALWLAAGEPVELRGEGSVFTAWARPRGPGGGARDDEWDV